MLILKFLHNLKKK